MEDSLKYGCSYKQMRYVAGTTNRKWTRRRVLNGDEKMSLRFEDMPQVMLVKMYQY